MSCNLSIICGLHRSGTTFVGEIVKRGDVHVLHEPLNVRFGMSGVPVAYPYVESNDSPCARVIDDAVSFKRPWNRSPDFLVKKGLRQRLYCLSGGRGGLHWDFLRLLSCCKLLSRDVCWKDPFASLATPYLVAKFSAKIVYIVRHPAAVHYSTQKQNWWFDIDNLTSQKELIAAYGNDIPEEHWVLAKRNRAASIALLWKMAVRVNLALSKKSSKVLLVLHEDLCLDPLSVAGSIIRHLGLKFSPEMKDFIIENSQGDRTEAGEGMTRDFFRDSKGLINAWRGKLTKCDEDIMQNIIGEDILSIYESW